MKQALVFITLAGCSQIFGLETPREVDAAAGLTMRIPFIAGVAD